MVTANKQLVAQHGDELFDAAREAGVQLRFEAAVAGGRPGDPGDPGEPRRDRDIERVFGIVNGTTNFILSRDGRTGATYARSLARAQELGYAEADPTEDVDGADAAAKMAILARLAFDTPVSLADVSYEGITEIQPDDLAYAKELGLSLKLLGVAERRDEAISVRVFPCFLYADHPLAPVEGPFNAVTVEAPAITEITMSGPAPAGSQTATAVLGDLVSILSGEAPVDQPRARARRDPRGELVLLPAPRGGRPAARAGAGSPRSSARASISVQSVVQRGLGDDARLVMVLHEAPEAPSTRRSTRSPSSTSCAPPRGRSGWSRRSSLRP